MIPQMTSKEAAPSAIQGTTSQTPNPTGSETRTRSGRIVKKPERYAPVEVCDDDYESNEYDSDESNSVSSDASIDPDDISSESDADENGNLDGFVVEDKSDESCTDSDVSGSSGSETDA
jgi:hypothetical protein